MAICVAPDGSRLVIPVWMLDRVACVTLVIGPPRCSLTAYRELRSLLDVIGSHGRTPAHRCDGQEEDHAPIHQPAATLDPAIAPPADGGALDPLDEPTRAALVRLLASLSTSACASAAGREERDETR